MFNQLLYKSKISTRSDAYFYNFVKLRENRPYSLLILHSSWCPMRAKNGLGHLLQLVQIVGDDAFAYLVADAVVGQYHEFLSVGSEYTGAEVYAFDVGVDHESLFTHK